MFDSAKEAIHPILGLTEVLLVIMLFTNVVVLAIMGSCNLLASSRMLDCSDAGCWCYDCTGAATGKLSSLCRHK